MAGGKGKARRYLKRKNAFKMYRGLRKKDELGEVTGSRRGRCGPKEERRKRMTTFTRKEFYKDINGILSNN